MDAQRILHSIPRFTWRLKITDNEWQPPDKWNFWEDFASDSSPYEQSLWILLLSPIIFLFFAWFLYQCFVCSVRFCNSKKRAERGMSLGRLKPWARCWLMVVLMFALGTMISVILFTIFLGKQVDVIEKLVNMSYVPYKNAMTNTSNIVSTLEECRNMSDILEGNGVDVSSIKGIFVTVPKWLDTYYSAVNIDWTITENAKADQTKDIKDVSLVWFILCVLLFVMTWFRGWLYGKFCCGLALVLRWLIRVVLIVGTIVIFGLVAAQFTLSVQVADICDDFAESVHKVINKTEKPLASDIVLYYVYCDGRFDYREDLRHGYMLLQNNSGAIFSCVEGVTSSSAFDNNTKHTAMKMWNLYSKTMVNTRWLIYTGTDCNATGIHKDSLEVEETVCTTALNDWCLLWLLQLLTGCFLIFSNFFFHSCCRKHEFAKHESLVEKFLPIGHHSRVDYDDYQPGCPDFPDYPFPEGDDRRSPSYEYARTIEGDNAQVQKYVDELRSASSLERLLYLEKLRNQGFSCFAVRKAMDILVQEEASKNSLQKQW